MKILSIIIVLSLSHLAHGQNLTPAAAPQFKKTQISVAGQKLNVEVADDDQKREYGLMFRQELLEGHGMLFVFSDSDIRNFWMKNTLIPLSIGYFSAERKLLNTQEMKPASDLELHPQLYPSQGPAKYALEVPPGWFKRHHISTGAELIVTQH
jgi:uncharacterized membrane protein (UPF0127 family)